MSDPAMTERKCVVFDTSTLVADPEALSAYPGCDIVLPLRVIEELDGLKNRPGETGFLARQALREIEAWRITSGGALDKPVNLPGDSTLRVEVNGIRKDLLREHGLDPDKSDNRIIAAALGLNQSHPNVTVVSNDTAFRLKTAHLGLIASEHHAPAKEIGPGFTNQTVDSSVIEYCYSADFVEPADVGLPNVENHLSLIHISEPTRPY